LAKKKLNLSKKNLGWPEDKFFFVPDEVYAITSKELNSAVVKQKKYGRKSLKSINQNILKMQNYFYK
jgi:transketolase